MAVDLVISNGIQPSVMPDVAGMSRAQAESAITGAGLVVRTVTQEHSDTVAAGNVISQSPAAGTELAPGTAASITVSLGPIPAVEGEGEPPVDVDTAQEQLMEAFDTADINGDGKLSFEEALASVPGLTQAVFDALDTNGDGYLSPAELGMDAGCGCAGCQGGATKSSGDGFAVLFGLLGLAAMAGVKKW
jgi:beta-lactam-binding protein with PASTA domain